MSSTIPTSSNSHSLQPPPHDLIAPNFEGMQKQLQAHADAHGYKIIIRSSEKENSEKVSVRYNSQYFSAISWELGYPYQKSPPKSRANGIRADISARIVQKTSTVIEQQLALLLIHNQCQALTEIEEILKKYWTPLPPHTISETNITKSPSYQESNTITIGCSIPSTLVPSVLIDRFPSHKKKKRRKNPIDEQQVSTAPPLDLELPITNTTNLRTHPVQSPPPDMQIPSLAPPPSLLQIITSALNTKPIKPHSRKPQYQDPPNAISLQPPTEKGTSDELVILTATTEMRPSLVDYESEPTDEPDNIPDSLASPKLIPATIPTTEVPVSPTTLIGDEDADGSFQVESLLPSASGLHQDQANSQVSLFPPPVRSLSNLIITSISQILLNCIVAKQAKEQEAEGETPANHRLVFNRPARAEPAKVYSV
ncbi:hypothetical protein DFH28DRAFT_1130083 [Melampsora americana]|nr:hypothetical protein DFH28DRAFT_1130083 [Melampsora americana]